MSIGALIKQERLAAGLTLEELGERLGVGKAVISRWEAGNRLPGHAILRKLADALHIDVRTLIELRTTGPSQQPPDPVAARVAELVGELADPMAVRLIELFRGLSKPQRQNVLDLVEMAAKIARQGDKGGNPASTQTATV